MNKFYRSFVLFILLLLVISAAIESVEQAEIHTFMTDFIEGKAGNRYTNLDAAQDFAMRDVQIGEMKARLDLLEAACLKR